ncbi:hypothetical protein Tco_1189096 [Tanacetum coccineum]
MYDGIVIYDKHVAMTVIDDEETLILEGKSRSKISEKEKDPKVIKQNISHKPIDYEKLNRLSDDFGKRFTPQHELSVEHAFWLRMSNPTSKPFDASPVKIEAPKELPKVSLVNESLKKLKFHLSKFDNVVKIRTTPDAHIEVDKKCLEIAKKQLLLENDRLLQQIMSQDVLLTVMNSMSLIGESVNMDRNRNESCDKCFNLEAELLKSQNAHNIFESYLQLEKHSHLQDKDTTICKLKDIIKSMREKSKKENVNSDYGEIETNNVELENSVAKLLSKNEHLCKEINHVKQSAENEDLKAQIQDKGKLTQTTLSTSQEQDDILPEIVEQAKAKQPLDKELDFAYKHAQRIQELLVYVRDTCPNAIKLSAKKVESSTTSDSNTPCVVSSTGDGVILLKCGSKPTGNKKNDRISRPPSRIMKNKVEAQPRKVNKKNSVVEPIHDVDVKHSLLNANSEPICATCKKSMFDCVHDMCLLDFVENVNNRAKSAKKHKKQNI